MEKIVVGVDGSGGAEEALRWAVDEGRCRGWPVEAAFAWTYPHAVPGLGEMSDRHRPERVAEEFLSVVLREQVGEAADVEVTGRVVEGPPARALLVAAEDAGLLVVGSRGRGGFAGLVLGSVSQQCAHHASCPVVVVRHDGVTGHTGSGDRTTARIVVGVDGSQIARSALEWAMEEARFRHAAVDVVHAWQLPHVSGYPFPGMEIQESELEHGARQVLDWAVGGVQTSGAQAVEPILVCESPARALVETAKGADLLVVGSRGRGGFAGLLLGSVSNRVLHHATCPVVVIPPR